CDWCRLGDPWTLNDCLWGCREPHYTIGGWTQWGYHTDSNGILNTHPHRINNHQSWLYVEKTADGALGFDYGFRADVVYGVDAPDTQAFGEPPPQDHWDNPWDHGIYGWAVPQLYAELAYEDVSVKIGKFYTIHGYEVTTAPDNFFYSHVFTYYYSEPFTHTGVLATYTPSDEITLYGGWTAGWDTGYDRFSDLDDSKGSMFLGGVVYSGIENVTLTYVLSLGDLGVRGEGYTHSIIADVALTEKLNYIFHTDLVELNNSTFGGNHEFDINKRLIYWVNDCLGYGVRGEWWKTNGESLYAITGGVNYKPHANLVFRPEVRYQWGSEDVGIPVDELIFGIDGILTF
ncbi:MAG: outer membrane beta-barrel protein, partial [Planctomycetaceae bacterium]